MRNLILVSRVTTQPDGEQNVPPDPIEQAYHPLTAGGETVSMARSLFIGELPAEGPVPRFAGTIRTAKCRADEDPIASTTMIACRC